MLYRDDLTRFEGHQGLGFLTTIPPVSRRLRGWQYFREAYFAPDNRVVRAQLAAVRELVKVS